MLCLLLKIEKKYRNFLWLDLHMRRSFRLSVMHMCQCNTINKRDKAKIKDEIAKISIFKKKTVFVFIYNSF